MRSRLGRSTAIPEQGRRKVGEFGTSAHFCPRQYFPRIRGAATRALEVFHPTTRGAMLVTGGEYKMNPYHGMHK